MLSFNKFKIPKSIRAKRAPNSAPRVRPRDQARPFQTQRQYSQGIDLNAIFVFDSNQMPNSLRHVLQHRRIQTKPEMDRLLATLIPFCTGVLESSMIKINEEKDTAQLKDFQKAVHLFEKELSALIAEDNMSNDCKAKYLPVPLFFTRRALGTVWAEYCRVEDSKGPRDTCPICDCELNVHNKWKLSCDHTFCVHCVGRWSHAKREWYCPNCRAP